MKAGYEIMRKLLYGSFMLDFQQIFAAFCGLMTEICISLFFFASNSKLRLLLIVNNSLDTEKLNHVQTNFDSNVAIRTFDHELSAPKIKPSQTFLCFSDLSFYLLLFAEMLTAEVLRCFPQTESKGNFCLITVYTHKTFPQPQNLCAKKQTFSNRGVLSLRAAEIKRTYLYALPQN
jgi:hypothetical protein